MAFVRLLNEAYTSEQHWEHAGKCQWRGRLVGQSHHSGSADRPKQAALSPQRGQRDLQLTTRGRSIRLPREGEAQTGNSRFDSGDNYASPSPRDRRESPPQKEISMSFPEELAFRNATSKAELVRCKQLKPVELVDAAIARIER